MTRRAKAASSLAVLMLSAYFEEHRGGIEIVAGKLARGLSALGRDVVWAAAGTDAAPHGLKTTPLASLNITERFGIPLPLPYPSALRKLKELIEQSDAVVLHDVMYPAHLAAFLFARRLAKPVLVIQHLGTVPYRNPLLRGLMRLADRLITRPLLARADQVAFISETTARHFASVRFRRKPEIIHNGVDADIFRPVATKQAKAGLRRTLGLPASGKIALFVGRFVEKKGLDTLERLARLRPDITFILAGWGPIGPDNWALPNVRVATGKSGKSLAALYQASDVFVLPSVGEGFPLVVQEALACGLPVICGSESAGADRKAKPLLRGIDVKPGSPDLTAARAAREIDAALKDPASAARVRAKFAAARYDWSRIAARYDALIERLLASRTRAAARKNSGPARLPRAA